MCTLRGGKITLIREDGTHGIFFTQQPHCNNIKIGSSIICDVRIQNEQTRKVHCVIFVDTTNNVIKIKNASKKNPTLLNGVPIKKYNILNNRDTITIVKRKFLWTYAPLKRPNRVSSGSEINCVQENSVVGLQVENKPETEDEDAIQPETTPILGNNKKEKKIGRRITCKINKIPIGNIGKRLKAQKRITIHELRGGENIGHSSLEQKKEICDDGPVNIESENKTENTITPTVIITETDDPEKSIDGKNVENENITISSRSMAKCNYTTPLKDITRLQEKNIMTTPKGHHSMFPLEASTPFQMFENKNLNLAKLSKLEKSDSLVWSVSPATLSYREKSVAKSFTSASRNHSIKVVNELIDVDLLDKTVIKKTVSSSIYLIDLTTPDTSNLNTSQQRTPNKSMVKSSTLLKSAIKNSSVLTKTPKSNLHTIANSTIKKADRSSMVTSSVKKVLNMTNTKSSDISAAEKHKSLFLNKSVASYSTTCCELPKTSNLSLSTINKRKTVNLLESSPRNDKAIEVQLGGTPRAILRKSMANATPAKIKTAVEDRVATPGRKTTDHKKVKVNEILTIQAQQLDQTDDAGFKNNLSDIIEDKQQFNASENDNLGNGDSLHEILKSPSKHILSNDFGDVPSVMKLLNTPVLDDSQNVCVVKEIMKTPVKEISINTPAHDLQDVGGVEKLMKTPDKNISTNESTNVSEIKELNVSICTLPSIDIPPETINIEDFEDDDDQDDDIEFNEDFVSKNTSLDENRTMDQAFDELIGKKIITKTYSRKNSVTPEKRNNLTEFQTENIEKWVESVVNVRNDEVQPKPNNNQQILSNRFSNITPQTSVVEPIENINEFSGEDDDSDKQSSQDSEAECAFKKTAIIDPIDPHVSFRFENYDLSFASESEKSEVATQMLDIHDESALLNEEAEYIIPSTQQEQTPRRLTRSQLETKASNCNIDGDDSKDTFIIEDDLIIPETQVEVFQEDEANDNDFVLEMSSQALETNISLVLNGEEEILGALVDNEEDGSSNSSITEETRMPLNEEKSAIVAKNDSSILFIDDTIFMDKSRATPTNIESDRDTDDSSIILCDDDSVNIRASHLHRTRSKSETPKKIDKTTPKTTRKTMGDTINESVKLSTFHQEIDNCPPNTVATTDKYSKNRNENSIVISAKKQHTLKSPANDESNDVIDLSESLNESAGESADSDATSSSQLNVNLESELSGIEPLQEFSSVIVYENSDDEIISGVFDHLEKNITINSGEHQEINNSASQSMVENFVENAIVSNPQNGSKSNKMSPKRTVGEQSEKEASTKPIELDNKSATQIMVEECLEMDADVFENFDENGILQEIRGTSLSPENIAKPKKKSRKTVGDHLDVKDVVSKFGVEINTINLSVGDIDQIPIPNPGRRRAMSSDRKAKVSPQKVHNNTIAEINSEEFDMPELSIGDNLEHSLPTVNKKEEVINFDESKVSELGTNTANKSIEVPNVTVLGIDEAVLSQPTSITLCDGTAIEAKQLRTTRSKSQTPKKMNKQPSKMTRKTMGDPLNEKTKKISKFQEEIETCSNNLEGIEHLTVSRIKSKSMGPQKQSPKSPIITNKSIAVIDLNDSDDPSIANDMSSLVYVDSEDEMMDSVFDNLEEHPRLNALELENKSVSQAIAEESFELHSEVFQNFDENPNVRQARGGSLTPLKNVKQNCFKASRKTMGDKSEVRENVRSKFELELNNISLRVGDINQVPAAPRRRAMSVDNKTKSPQNILNKTVSEFDCEKLVVIDPSVCSQTNRSVQEINKSLDNSSQSHEIEKVVNKTVTGILVNENDNLDDTFEHDDSENLFNEEESDMFIPETQDIPVGSEFTKNSESIVIIPETQPDPHEISFSILENSQPDKSIQSRTSQLHKLSLNSPNRTKSSPKQIKSQSPVLDKLPKSLIENLEIVENVEVIEHAEVENVDKLPLILDKNVVIVEEQSKVSNPGKRKRRLYSKEAYNPVFDDSYDCPKAFLNKPTSTPVSKSGNYFDVKNISEDVASSSERTLTKKLLLLDDLHEVENEVPEKPYMETTEDKEPSTNNHSADNFKIARRVVFADKPEEKYFEVLSEYEESVKKPVRGRRPLASSKSVKNNDKEMLEPTNEKIVENKTFGREKRRRAPVQNEDVEDTNTDVVNQSETNLQAASTLEIEAIPVIDEQVKNLEQNSGRGKNRPQTEKKKAVVQKILVEDIEPIPIVNEITSEERKQKTSTRGRSRRVAKEGIIFTEHLEQEVSGRGGGRRAPTKQKIEVVNDAISDNKKDIEDVVVKPVVVQEVKISDEHVEPKTAGRGRSRRLAKKKETEMIIELPTESEKEIKTILQSVSTKDNEITLVAEKDIISNEHLEETTYARGKGRRAPTKKEIELVSETVIDDINEISTTKQVIPSENIEVIPVVEREVKVSQQVEQKIAGRGRGRRGLKKKQEIEIISETNTEDETGTNDQVDLAKDTEPMLVVDEIVKNSDENLQPTNVVEVKTSIRGRGRRELANNKAVEIISETKIDNKNEIVTDIQAVPAKHEERKKSVETNENINSEDKVKVSEIHSEETDENKTTGRGRTRRGPIKKYVESDIEDIDEVVTTSALEKKTGKESVEKKTTGRRQGKQITKKEVISENKAESKVVESTTTNEIEPDSKLNSPEKTGRRKARDVAANKKNVNQVAEDERIKSVTPHEEKKKGRGRARAAPNKKLIDVESTAPEDPSHEVNVVNINIHEATTVEEVFATPLKPAVRLRRLGTKRYVTDSESEQLSESPNAKKKRRLIKEPNDTANDTDVSSIDEIDEIHKKPSRNRKVVTTKPSKLETPVKSRSRRGLQKQAVEIENENVMDTPASLVASHEETTSKSAVSENDNKIETPTIRGRGRRAKPLLESNTSLGMVKEDTPLKSRGRRAAAVSTEKLEIPAKRVRKAKNIETSELELSATDLIITGTETPQEQTPIGTKPKSYKNEKVADASSEKQSSNTRLRKAKDGPKDEVSTSKTAESSKVSRAKRSRAK